MRPMRGLRATSRLREIPHEDRLAGLRSRIHGSSNRDVTPMPHGQSGPDALSPGPTRGMQSTIGLVRLIRLVVAASDAVQSPPLSDPTSRALSKRRPYA